MKFIVSRTSMYCKKRPCREAKREKVVKYKDSVLTLSTLSKWIAQLKDIQGKVYKKMPDGHLRFYEPTEVWVIEIKTLDELIRFYEKYGDLILEKSETEEIPFEIEIYDDYRE